MVLPIAVTAALTSQAGCGAARRAGKGAAEGAITKLSGTLENHEPVVQFAQTVKQRMVGAAVDELSQPERLEEIRRIAAAAAAGAVMGASSAASGGPRVVARAGEGDPSSSPDTPVETIAAQAVRAFSRELTAQLGRDGKGGLATSLSATTEQMTASMGRGVRGELAALFPECSGGDVSACVDRAVERASRATSAGVAAGVRESLGVLPIVVAFVVGVFATLAVAWAWAIYRTRH